SGRHHAAEAGIQAAGVVRPHADARSDAEVRQPTERRREAPQGTQASEKFGATPQPSLPVEPELFELDEPDRVCPSCGGELQPMKGQFDTSELIDVIEVRYRLIQVNQQKYRC